MSPTALRLKYWRERRGLTEVELADASGIPLTTISRLERGYTRTVELDMLDRLAKVLKVRPSALLETTSS